MNDTVSKAKTLAALLNYTMQGATILTVKAIDLVDAVADPMLRISFADRHGRLVIVDIPDFHIIDIINEGDPR